ncbi:hypothetical protein RIR_jg4651.t1 [Rhizophagus irregularis DAOM 181602=DAOM 197198]|nr:hypothetical protein RIR_jg4651.t1 [Rhizophagus irregularis DAOM 181602=DAOM 197198]
MFVVPIKKNLEKAPGVLYVVRLEKLFLHMIKSQVSARSSAVAVHKEGRYSCRPPSFQRVKLIFLRYVKNL